MAIRRLLPAIALLLWVLPAAAFDSDDDGIPNKYDLCKDQPEDKDGMEDNDGRPDPDNDKDGVCDPFVAEKGLGNQFNGKCRGSDKCVEVPEDRDGYQDEDGCPDADNDADGIPDKKDKCVSEGEDRDGFEDNDGCPDPDNDMDGVVDAEDKCASAPEDKDSFEDMDGCPELDNDADAVKDVDDKCPNQPENVNGVDDGDGCPDKTMPALESVQTFPLVQFRSSTAELTVEGEKALELFAKQLVDYPEKVVEIRLFTWYKGRKKDEYLANLVQRSKAVVSFLVEKGVKPEQLKEIEYTLENFEAYKGTERDFNQEKPMESHLQN